MWIETVCRATAAGPVVRAVVVAAMGSVPREVGAWLLVSADAAVGTIGGGALEFDVIGRARAMLQQGGVGWLREAKTYHLGPDLDQCCGGQVTILLERFGAAEAAVLAGVGGDAQVRRPLESGAAPDVTAGGAAVAELDAAGWFVEPVAERRTKLMLYGAGHVGTALARVLTGLPFRLTWVDGQKAADAAVAAATRAPAGAFHVVMTHSHALDEAIVAAVLRAGGFGYLGLIGSATKGARFRQRLLRAGVTPELVERMQCPVGLVGLGGKEPAVIAVSVAAELLLRRQGVAKAN
jgi:xanthine dehydrogenase accessory factor